MFKTKIKEVIVSLITNPILLIIYWIFFYALASLCRYGRYNNNIYKDGVEGIFKDIKKKIVLPSKLFMSTNFTLNYNEDGTITSFDTFVYGKNKHGKENSYLISYDSKKSKDITVVLNGYANPTYNKDKLLEPLIETVNTIPFDKVKDKFNAENYGLVYYGKRDWGNDTEGMVFLTRGTPEENAVGIQKPVIGYTVSIFVPGEIAENTPMRFNLVNGKEWSQSRVPPTDGMNNVQSSNENNTNTTKDSKEQSYMTKAIGYRLDVTAAALGSRSYSLSKTTNYGKDWTVINENPFGDTLGVANGVKFINEKIGFIGLSKNGGTNAYLYRTDDGGKTFKEVNYPTHKIVQDGKDISQFDFPNMPYEKDGVLEMKVGQGSDGDYLEGGTGLYESKNQGETWTYVKEIKDNSESN